MFLKSYLRRNGMRSLLFLFVLFSLSYSEKILLVGTFNLDTYKNAIGAEFHTILTKTTTSFGVSDIDRSLYDQIWLMQWNTESQNLPDGTISPALQTFMANGGKVALFTDGHSVWNTKRTAVINFVNSVVPSPTFALSNQGTYTLEMDVPGVNEVDPQSASLFAGKTFSGTSLAYAQGAGLAGGIGVLQVQGSVARKGCVVFPGYKLKNTYSAGRLTVYGDIGDALSNGNATGNQNILKFIAAMTTGPVANISISPNKVFEDTTIAEGSDDLANPEHDGSDSVYLYISLSDTLDVDVTLDWVIQSITATQGSDYTATTYSGQITFPKGDTLAKIGLYIYDDSDNDDNETFSLKLNNPSVANKIKFANGTDLIDTITIIDDDPDNVAPDATDDNVNIDEGDSSNFSILANDTDEDKATLVITILSNATYGDLTINTNGTVKYKHDNSEHFTDSFKYKITDQAGEVDSAIVYVTINPINDNNPNAINQTYSVDEGGTLNISAAGVLVGNTDIDVDQTNTTAYDWLQASLKSSDSTEHGTLTLNSNGSFTYIHNGSHENDSSDTFTYYSIDSLGHKDSALVTITINLQNDNDPVAVVDTIVVDEGDSTSLLKTGQSSVLYNDTDIDGKTGLTATKTSDPTYGVIAFNSNGTFTYQHNNSENFLDSFTYTAYDGTNTSTAGTVIIIINPVNDNTPVAVKDSIVVNEGNSTSTLYNSETNLLWNDSDIDLPNDNLTVSIVSGVNNGALSLNLDGTFTYTHNGSEIFTDSFSYELKDAVGHLDTAIVKISIAAVNDNTPIATDDAIAVAQGEDTTKLINGALSVLNNDSDPDTGDSLVVALVSDVSNGTLTLNSDGTFIYTHNGGVILTDEFKYEVTDLAGHKDTATVSIIAGATNTNNPVAVKDSIATSEGNSTSILVSGNSSVLDNDTDGDMPYDNLTASIYSSVTNGDLTLNPNGTFTYTHNGSENFTDSFIYEVEDAAGHTDTVTVKISISPVNDNTPVAITDTIIVNEGETATTLKNGQSSLLWNDTDGDLNDTLTIDSISVDVSNGTLTVNPDGTFSYKHNGSANFTDQFTYIVSDLVGAQSAGNVIIIINELNDNAPVSIADSVNVLEGDSATVLTNGNNSVLTNDSDLDGMDVVFALLVNDVLYGDLTLDSNGTFVYIHDDSEHFIDSFTYKANDGVQDGNTVTVYINITPVNDNSPIGVGDSIVVSEGGITTVLYDSTATVLANDNDADINTILSAILIDSTIYGDIYLLDDGTFSYDHNGSENFVDQFTYLASDGDSLSDTIIVKITIVPINDNLTITNSDTITLIEGQSQTVLKNGSTSVLDNDTDIDGMSVVTALLVKKPLHGTITLNSDGTFEYQHNGTENYDDFFTYVAIDGTLDTTEVETVIVDVTPIPKPSKAHEAAYYDTDGNGIIDSLHFKFTKPIILKDDTGKVITTFKILWDTTTITLNIDSSNLNSDSTIMTVDPSSLLGNTPKTSGTMYLLSTFLLHDPIGDTLFDTTVADPVSDKAAPVLTRAEYLFNKIENPIDLSGSDSSNFDALLIDFSEPVSSINGDYPFNFQKNNSSADEYQMELELVDLTTTRAFFKVLSLKGAYYPDKDDSTWIYADAENYPSLYVADVFNNRQETSENRKVPLILEVPELDINVQILHLIGNPKPIIPDELKVESVDFNSGAVLLLTSDNPGNSQEVLDHLEAARKQISIFDLVGNEVISIDNESNKDLHIGIGLVGGKPALKVNWNGNNSNGRAVASGSYVIIVRLTDDPMFQNKEEIKKVNIKQYTE